MKKLFLSLLLVLFSIGAWAENQKKLPPDYVPPGDFYWTRVFWKETKDTFWRGEIRFTDEHGYGTSVKNPYVIGIETTGWIATELNNVALELLDRYKSTHEKNVFKDYPAKVGRSIKRLFSKTGSHLMHKAEKIGEIALRNYDRAISADYGSLLIAYPLYTAQTVIHSILVGGFEWPVEFTGRTLYRLGEVSYHTLSPVGPAAGAAVVYLIAEPLIIVIGGGTSMMGGATGVIITGLVATVEGGKWILGDREKSLEFKRTAVSQEKAMLYVKLPERPSIEKTLDQIFTEGQSKTELFDGFEQLIAAVDPQEQWIVMGNIVGRLERTIRGLEENLDGKSSEQQAEIIKEWDELSTLKIVYAIDLEKNMPRDLGAFAFILKSK